MVVEKDGREYNLTDKTQIAAFVSKGWRARDEAALSRSKTEPPQQAPGGEAQEGAPLKGKVAGVKLNGKKV